MRTRGGVAPVGPAPSQNCSPANSAHFHVQGASQHTTRWSRKVGARKQARAQAEEGGVVGVGHHAGSSVRCGHAHPLRLVQPGLYNSQLHPSSSKTQCRPPQLDSSAYALPPQRACTCPTGPTRQQGLPPRPPAPASISEWLALGSDALRFPPSLCSSFADPGSADPVSGTLHLLAVQGTKHAASDCQQVQDRCCQIAALTAAHIYF